MYITTHEIPNTVHAIFVTYAYVLTTHALISYMVNNPLTYRVVHAKIPTVLQMVGYISNVYTSKDSAGGAYTGGALNCSKPSCT